MNFAVHNRINAFFFRIKTARRSFVNEHIFTDSRRFYDGIIRAKISLQNCNSAGRSVRIFNAVNNVRTFDFRTFDSFGNRAGNRECVEVKNIFLCKFVHNRRNAARFLQVLHMVSSGGTEFCNIRSSARNFVKESRRNFNTGLFCYRRQMQNGI